MRDVHRKIGNKQSGQTQTRQKKYEHDVEPEFP